MTERPLFQRLERTVRLIARHPFFPGKNEAVNHCLADLEERFRDGLLTLDQKARLVAILFEEQAAGAEPGLQPVLSAR